MVGALGLPQKTMAQQSTLPILDTLAVYNDNKITICGSTYCSASRKSSKITSEIVHGIWDELFTIFFSHIAKFKLEKPGYYAVFFWMLLGSSQSTHPSQEVDGGYDLKMGLVRATITMLVKRALVTSAPSQKW